jgi:hypothetical protein
MGVKGLTWGVAILIILAVFFGGCGGKGPDWVTIGGAVRQVGLSYLGQRSKILLPVGEVRLIKEFTPHLDGEVRLQFISQPPMMIPTVMVGGVNWDEVTGNFQSFGLGLNYFPWETRAIGVELGAEIFRAEYEIESGVLRIADHFWGGGANLGLVGEIPLDQRWKCHLVWGGGYNFTASTSEATIEKAEVDLDGWYGTLGIKVRL